MRTPYMLLLRCNLSVCVISLNRLMDKNVQKRLELVSIDNAVSLCVLFGRDFSQSSQFSYNSLL